MSWDCPHQRYERDGKPFCGQLRKPCKPLVKGCILEGRFKRVDINMETHTMSKKQVQTLDLRPMPPVERHATIFMTWDALKPGQAMRIINDHDPKPLYYQFEAEHKGRFRWKYEKQGPADWIVRIDRI